MTFDFFLLDWMDEKSGEISEMLESLVSSVALCLVFPISSSKPRSHSTFNNFGMVKQSRWWVGWLMYPAGSAFKSAP